MNEFNALMYLNCVIESAVLVLLWTALIKKPKTAWPYLIMFVCLNVASIIVIAFDTSVLIINIVLLFLCGYVCFPKEKIVNAVQFTAFAFLSLMYLQAFMMWIVPRSFITSQSGNLVINGLVLAIAFTIHLLSRKYKWAEFYGENKTTVWLFLLLLSVPSIVLMQVIVCVLNDKNYLLIFSLMALQLCYLLALILAFVLHRRKQERMQIINIEETLRNQDLFIEESKQRIHDFNKHINFIHSMVATQSNQPELKAAIDNYCKDALYETEKEEILLHINDPTFRALLYRRELQANDRKVSLMLQASTILPTFPLNQYQMVTVFDNLVDNAFEYLEGYEQNKWITIILQAVSLENGQTRNILSVQNPFDEIDFKSIVSEKYYSTKSGCHKGVGLHKVAKIVSDSGGTFTLNNDCHLFTAKITYDWIPNSK